MTIDSEVRSNSIDVVNVTHEFTGSDGRPRTAIRDISMNVPAGRFVAIVGPSGCGKTTLLAIISGLLKPTSGQIKIGGQVSTEPRQDVGYMPARDSLFPWRTCQRNIELPLELQRRHSAAERREIATVLLKAVGLEGFEAHYPAALSHGMRQRVAVARTFATKPDVLLMDEPFSALDAQTRIVVQDLFLNMWESQHQTVVLITHDVVEAVALADAVVVLSSAPGVIKSVHEIDLPRPRSVKYLLFDEPRFQGYLKAIWSDLDV